MVETKLPNNLDIQIIPVAIVYEYIIVNDAIEIK